MESFLIQFYIVCMLSRECSKTYSADLLEREFKMMPMLWYGKQCLDFKKKPIISTLYLWSSISGWISSRKIARFPGEMHNFARYFPPWRLTVLLTESFLGTPFLCNLMKTKFCQPNRWKGVSKFNLTLHFMSKYNWWVVSCLLALIFLCIIKVWVL